MAVLQSKPEGKLVIDWSEYHGPLLRTVLGAEIQDCSYILRSD
jgi:hypothetical protein